MLDFTNAECDRCYKQAYHLVTRDDLELLFCNHHFNEHQPELLMQGWAFVVHVEGLKSIGVLVPA